MKKLFILLSAAAIMLAGCAQEADYTPAEKTFTLQVEVVDNSTKTYTEGDKIYWSKTGEQINIIYFADESTSRRQTATHEDYILADNKITFTADLNKTEGASKYTLGAFYPYAYKSTTSSVSLTVPQVQTPTATSYDPKADILVSAQPVVTEGLPEKISFQFSRMVALVNMTVTGIAAGESIEKITVISSAKPAGTVTFKVHEQNTVENAVWYNNYEDITLNMGGRIATGNDDVWFVTVPTDLSGKDLTVKVSTDKNDYIKTIDLTGKTLYFERANIARFTVKDLAVAEKPKTYKLLTDVAELNAGDKVVISTKNVTTSNTKLLSTTPYDATKISLVSYVVINDNVEIEENAIPADAAIFTLETGATPGTFAFKNESNGYLYGTYDNVNWSSALAYSSTMVDGASWTVELISNGAKMSSCYDGSNVRYLNNYDNYKFNFANSRGTSYNYYIFYMDAEGSDEPGQPEQPVVTPLATPVVTATAEGNTVTASWAAVEGAADYTVTFNGATQTVSATTVTFSDLAYATEYTVSVVANPADATANTASEAGTVTVTTEADPNAGAAETITLSFPENFPAGAASGNNVGTIHDGDILISSTGSWRTDNADGRDCIYIGRTTSNEFRIEAKNGKVITKVTLTAPTGYLIDLQCKEYDGYTTTKFASLTTCEWTGECKSRLVYTPVGNSHTNIQSITIEYR